MERWTIYFSGQVQGVGFRYTTRQLARAGGFDVSGFVRNLDDGRVELVIEGQPQVLAEFLAALRNRMGDHIQKIQQIRGPATGEFPARTLVIGH